jgi:hypothetical protein
LRTTRPDIVRALRAAAAIATATAFALAATSCGGGGSSVATTDALTSLYVIDHGGANPTGDALNPYEAAFSAVRKDCDGSVEDLASSIQDMASSASNGSGTTITNLDAMRAMGRYLKQNPQPTEDCAGIFVGVEAYLEGGALG